MTLRRLIKQHINIIKRKVGFMNVSTCNTLIDNILEQYVVVKDKEPILANVDIHVVNTALGIDITGIGNFYKQDRAYIFSMKIDNWNQIADIHNQSNDLKFGDYYSDNYFFQIGLEINGKAIKSSKSIYYTSDPSGLQVYFRSYDIEILYVDSARTGNCAELVILGRLKFMGNRSTNTTEKSPYGIRYQCSRDVSVTTTEKYEIIIKQYSDQTRLNITRVDKADVTESDIEGILYSLSIIRTELLYQSVGLKMLQKGMTITFVICPDYSEEFSTTAFPPIYSTCDLYWDYEILFKHLIDNYSVDNRDYFLSIIKVICDSKAVTQTHLLSLCTAIECLSDKIHVTENEVDIRIVNELVQSATDIINKEIDPIQYEEMNRRIIGCLNRVRNDKSAKNKLKKLKDDGVLFEKSFSTWNDIRNALAHGSNIFNPAKYEKYHSSIKLLYLLMYQLFFVLLDYHGEYTDYSSIDKGNFVRKVFNAETG